MREDGRKKTARKRTPRSKKTTAPIQVGGDRYTPLLTREGFTYSRMKLDGSGPRSYSAICFPGWIRA